MSAADVLVHPSTGIEEASPLAMHEAQAFGLLLQQLQVRPAELGDLFRRQQIEAAVNEIAPTLPAG